MCRSRPPEVLALLADRKLDLVDLEGRFLLEQADVRATPESIACPWNDSRRGHPMNRAAWEQVQRHWGQVCEELTALVPPRATPQQALQACWEMVTRALLAAGPLDVSVAVGYKVCVGFCQVLLAMVLIDDGETATLKDWGDEGDFLAWLERERWLHGQKQVCSASPAHIGRVYRILSGGQAKVGPASARLKVLALQAGLILSTYQALRQGHPEDDSLGCRLLRLGQAPWFFALTARPNLKPERVGKLLESHWEPLEHLLRQTSPPAQEEAFWEGAASLF